MLESSLKIGSVAGIRIGIHYTWLIVFVLISWTLNRYFAASHPDWSSATTLAASVISALLFFGSIILHELGHSIVAIRRGITVRSITLFIFGGVAQSERDSDSALTEFLVAIAGPMVSLLLAGFFDVMRIVLSPISDVAMEACRWLSIINFAVALFNMVPGFPLDGGRVFRSLVWGATGNAAKGMSWAVAAGKIVAYGLMGLGIYASLSIGSIFGGIWYFAIGWFLLVSAQASARAFTVDRVTHGLTVRDLMVREAPTVAAATSIADWINEDVLTEGTRADIVLDNGRAVGLVSVTDSKKVPREHWATTTLREIMTPMSGLKTLAPDMPAAAALEQMAGLSLNEMPVLEGAEIVGWVDREHLAKLLRLRMETAD
jgi:Zn-dependent protease